MEKIFLPYFQCVWLVLQCGLQNLSLMWFWSCKLTEELYEVALDVKAAFSLCEGNLLKGSSMITLVAWWIVSCSHMQVI